MATGKSGSKKLVDLLAVWNALESDDGWEYPFEVNLGCDTITIGGHEIDADAAELLTSITASADELNILDGCVATTDELNIMVGVTVTAEQINLAVTLFAAVTASAAELNIMAGCTSSTAELNILDGCTATAAELNCVAGVTPGTLAASKAMVVDANSHIDALKTTALYIGASGSAVQVTATAAELNYVAGVTPGTLTASKAMVVDANSHIDALKTTALYIGASGSAVQVTSTAAELNKLDGCTATYTELNYLAGVTPGSPQVSKALVTNADGKMTSLSVLALSLGGASVTATAAELNKLDGCTATYAELNYLDVTAGSAGASKAVVLNSGGDITWYDGGDIAFGTSTGTKLGTGSTQKIGFYGATPIVRPVNSDLTTITVPSLSTIFPINNGPTVAYGQLINDIADRINAIIDVLTDLGLCEAT